MHTYNGTSMKIMSAIRAFILRFDLLVKPNQIENFGFGYISN